MTRTLTVPRIIEPPKFLWLFLLTFPQQKKENRLFFKKKKKNCVFENLWKILSEYLGPYTEFFLWWGWWWERTFQKRISSTPHQSSIWRHLPLKSLQTHHSQPFNSVQIDRKMWWIGGISSFSFSFPPPPLLLLLSGCSWRGGRIWMGKDRGGHLRGRWEPRLSRGVGGSCIVLFF